MHLFRCTCYAGNQHIIFVNSNNRQILFKWWRILYDGKAALIFVFTTWNIHMQYFNHIWIPFFRGLPFWSIRQWYFALDHFDTIFDNDDIKWNERFLFLLRNYCFNYQASYGRNCIVTLSKIHITQCSRSVQNVYWILVVIFACQKSDLNCSAIKFCVHIYSRETVF